jgi:predicted metalloprotease with PDZ domain
VSAPRDPGALRFEVRFEGRRQRRFEVQAVYPTRGREAITVAMPVWIPGSYLLREFARNVIAPSARTLAGAELPLEKVAKNRLRVRAPKAAEAVVLSYRVYASELTVRTNFVGPDYAVLNPAATFFSDVAHPDAPIELALHLPASWPEAHAALPRVKTVGTSSAVGFRAPDFDALVDAPVIAGPVRIDGFEARGVPHHLVSVGDLRRFPFERAARDVEKIARAQADFWGGFPYERYHFLSVLDEAGGGLEHRASTLIMFPPDRAAGDLAGWRRWLGLVSHELFHAWNGKRLRPEVLGPFDLEREAYTESLWFVEGLTSYYDDLLLRRAGLHDDESYLAALTRNAARLARTPGEAVQSLAQASYDAWIEFYRPDAASANTAVSYYVKGSLVAFRLDAAIRARTGGDQSLDDVLRAAYARFSGEEGYSDDAIYDVLEEVGGPEVRALALKLVREPGVLDLEPALRTFGLRFDAERGPLPDDPLAARAERAERAWLGLSGEVREGRFFVREVRRDGPAWRAGLRPEDEVIALGDDRVPPEGLEGVLERHGPGDAVEVLVARRGRIRTLEAVVGERPRPPRIVIDEDASHAAKRQRARWLLGT